MNLVIEQITPEQTVCRGFHDEGCAEVVIPEGVTEIADFAFCNQDAIVRIHCPNSIRIIGKEAFQCCEQMEEIILPAEAEGTLMGTFHECYQLRRVTVPRGITEIAESTFYSCEHLDSVIIPNTVKKIGGAAFYSCCALKELFIPDSVDEINACAAFFSCKALETVRLPEQVRFIWEENMGCVLFYNCPALQRVLIGEREFAFDPNRFRQFEDAVEDCWHPWSDEELKALLTLCCSPVGHDRPAYDVSRECLETVSALAII